MFSKKAIKIDEIFTVDLTVCSKYQIDGEDFVKCCGLLRKHELCMEPNWEIVSRTKLQNKVILLVHTLVEFVGKKKSQFFGFCINICLTWQVYLCYLLLKLKLEKHCIACIIKSLNHTIGKNLPNHFCFLIPWINLLNYSIEKFLAGCKKSSVLYF